MLANEQTGRGRATLARWTVWFFLAPACFSTKTPTYERWISLDFLGFSRPKQDLSMGYTRFSLENFSRRFLALRSAKSGAGARHHGEGHDCSWGKLSSVSDFLQEIAVRAAPIQLFRSTTSTILWRAIPARFPILIARRSGRSRRLSRAALGWSRRARQREPGRLFLRHPCFAQAVIRPLAHLDEAWIAALFGDLGHLVRLPCRDRLERRGGGPGEVALQRLARFRIMIGQGERRHEDHMRERVGIRTDRDRPASCFNRLVIILQPEIGPCLAVVPIDERPIGRARRIALSKYSRLLSNRPRNR
jgi:hypothetical protein